MFADAMVMLGKFQKECHIYADRISTHHTTHTTFINIFLQFNFLYSVFQYKYTFLQN